MAFSPDGGSFASTYFNDMIRIWDVRSRKLVPKADSPEANLTSVAISPDGSAVVVGAADRTLWLWEVGKRKLVRKVSLAEPEDNWPAVFSADLRLAAAAGERVIHVWEVSTGKSLERLEYQKGARPAALVFSPDAKTLYAGCPDGSIRSWDLDTTKEARSFTGHTNQVRSLAISPDGRTLVSGSSDLTVRLWDLGSGKQLQCLEGHTGEVWAAVFSPDGDTIASVGDGTLRVWSASSGKETRRWPVPSGVSLSFVAGGKLVALESWRVIRLWETATGRQLPALAGHRGTGCRIAASSQTAIFVSASTSDNTVVVWDAERILRRKAFSEHLEAGCWEFLWNGLASEEVARDASSLLAAYPAQTVAEIKRRLDDANLISAEVTRLIGKLQADDVATRETAYKRLEELREAALPAMKRYLSASPGGETRRRVGSLLEKNQPLLPGEERKAQYVARILEELAAHAPDYPWVGPARQMIQSQGLRFPAGIPREPPRAKDLR
jgi:dipeptidyl aminopeptidase/acylaminoacyl peptidase